MAEIRVLGGLRGQLGAARLRLEAASVGALLDALVSRGEPGLAAMLFEDPGTGRALHRDLRVLVNGRSIEFLDGVETGIGPEDTVTLHLAGARGFPGG